MTGPGRGTRPLHVWLIGVLYLLGYAWLSTTYVLILSGVLPGTPYLAQLTIVDHVGTAIVHLAALGGAVSLLRLRRVAVPCFGVYWLAMTVTTGWQLLSKPALGGLVRDGQLWVLLGYLLGSLVTAHVYWLGRRGVLR